MFRKGDIVRKVGEEELYTVLKTNVPVQHMTNTRGRKLFRKSKAHMIIKDGSGKEQTVLKKDYEHVLGGRRSIKPFSFN